MLNPFKRKKTEEAAAETAPDESRADESAATPDSPGVEPQAPKSDQPENAPTAAPEELSQQEPPESRPEGPLAGSEATEAPTAAAPQDEAQPAETPPPLETPAPARAAPRQGLLYHLFSPQTRLGRVMRPVVRWLATITGLFALGLLAGYILLYQPSQRRLAAVNAQLAAQAQTVNQKTDSLQTVTAARDQAQNALKQAQNELAAANSENQLLLVMIDVADARVALVNKDGQTAKTAIAKAQADLTKAQPYLESQDKTQTGLIQTRLNLVTQELSSDPQATLSDLTRLASDLAALRARLFGQ